METWDDKESEIRSGSNNRENVCPVDKESLNWNPSDKGLRGRISRGR